MNIALTPRAIARSVVNPRLDDSLLLQVGWTLLRVVAGTVMIHNGLDKLDDIAGFASAYVEVIGLPFPIFFAYCAAFAEFIGSVLLIGGLLTRLAAAALTSTMLVAAYHHVLVAGFSIPYLELSVLYAACFTLFALGGGGPFSLDALLARLVSDREAAARKALETTYRVAEIDGGAAADRERLSS